MKLKSYYMQDQSQPLGCLMEQSEALQLAVSKPKKKYLTKKKGYCEEGDFLYYNSLTDEQELAEVTNFRYTQDSQGSDSYF